MIHSDRVNERGISSWTSWDKTAGKDEDQQQQNVDEDESLPHAEFDLWCDGATNFKNSEQASVNFIMDRFYSWKLSYASSESARKLFASKPFFVGIEHSKNATTAKELLKEVIEEVIRLHPDNAQAKDRELTASIRIVVADTPIRAFLKGIIGHMGYWACERCIQRGVYIISVKEKKKTNSNNIESKGGVKGGGRG